MIQADVMAEHLRNQQPQSIRDRILNNDAFRAEFGLSYRKVVTVGRDVQIDQQSLFSAVRKVLESRSEQRVNDLSGKGLVVEYGQDAVVVSSVSEQGGMNAHIPDLMILSPHREERILALNNLINQMGPTAPNYEDLCLSAERRELSNDEIEVLLEERTNGVAAMHGRTLSACQASQASLDEIIPASLTYLRQIMWPRAYKH